MHGILIIFFVLIHMCIDVIAAIYQLSSSLCFIFG